ncbi:hypothetical protein NCC78_05870 [Micromonospora phytophila]|uniref:hypothetical protein n=1 Tax=Micromonospora phytophila TaxID=709888 RepID=UPI00202FA65B|nr:hypothetical protein [Micromonospora phytophila]MCM0674216.1 hypothetical protein [Micromonospora phytophila]
MSLRPSQAERPPGVDRHGLWARRLVAFAVAATVTGAVAVGVSRLPLDAMDSGSVDLVVWLLTGALLLSSRRWRPRRRSRLVWRARVAGRHGFAPGLVARRSLVGWTELGRDLTLLALLPLMLLASLPEEDWSRIARLVVAAGIAVLVGRMAYDVARFTGALALTADGIRQGRRCHEWSTIEQARLHREGGQVDGVYLRPRVWTPVKRGRRVVGGWGVAVSDERLLAAIEEYRTRPEMLAVRLPVTAPEPAPTVEPTR